MAKKRKSKGSRKPKSNLRKLACLLVLVLIPLLVLYAALGDWFVHHSRKWIDAKRSTLPALITSPLLFVGNPVGDITDAFAITGHDAVYEYDEPAPEGETLFAGAPKRTGFPAPTDIRILDRGDFIVGWSDKLRHPVWCAYHLTKDVAFEAGKRPNFIKDKSVESCPTGGAYERCGYDRGHMVPNYAMVTRYGEDVQKRTFLMTNIAPQSPALNRGVWRQIEHRIADLWTARYGEIWVIVGCISGDRNGETLSGTDIDVPSRFYQVVVAQEGLDIRAFAVVFEQEVAWDAWPTRHLVTIDELEEMAGLDFLPELPGFIQEPLEAELPSRLWPIRKRDIFRQIGLRFHR